MRSNGANRLGKIMALGEFMLNELPIRGKPEISS
jgi:hypothetical protein